MDLLAKIGEHFSNKSTEIGEHFMNFLPTMPIIHYTRA